MISETLLTLGYFSNGKKDSFLHVLIPREGVQNEQCTMFVERAAMRGLFVSSPQDQTP